MILDNNSVKHRTVSLETVAPESEFSRTFLAGMLSRMAMSFFKYGKVRDAYPDKVDAVSSLRLRLAKYEETGNTEFLMDVANFAMIEFMAPRHPGAFFEATDSDQSPGRVGHNGARNQNANDSRIWKVAGSQRPASLVAPVDQEGKR
jgi:hypothetical protein